MMKIKLLIIFVLVFMYNVYPKYQAWLATINREYQLAEVKTSLEIIDLRIKIENEKTRQVGEFLKVKKLKEQLFPQYVINHIVQK